MSGTQGFVVLTLVPEVSFSDINLPAATDLSASQFCFAKITTTDVVIAGAGDKPLGVLQNAPNQTTMGKTACIRTGGLSKLTLGADCSIGDFLKSDGSGNGIPASSGDFSCAYALTGGLSGEDIAVVVQFVKVP